MFARLFGAGAAKPTPAAAPKVTVAHLEMLAKNRTLGPKLDQVYGAGAAAKICGHFDILIADPSFAEKFDVVYDSGAAAVVLRASPGAMGQDAAVAALASAAAPHVEKFAQQRYGGEGGTEQAMKDAARAAEFSAKHGKKVAAAGAAVAGNKHVQAAASGLAAAAGRGFMAALRSKAAPAPAKATKP